MDGYILFALGVVCGITGSYLMSDLVFAPTIVEIDSDDDSLG
jgi:hypothetical protein